MEGCISYGPANQGPLCSTFLFLPFDPIDTPLRPSATFGCLFSFRESRSAFPQGGVGPSWVPGGRAGPSPFRGGAICLLLSSAFIVQCLLSFCGSSATPMRLAFAEGPFCGLPWKG